jgi:predicted CXXCH cytochrome family protein
VGSLLASSATASVPRIRLQASHPIGVPVVPGAGDRWNHVRRSLDPRIELFDRRIECQTCHRLTNPENDHLVPFETKYQLCRGCHEHETEPSIPMIASAR